MVFEGKTNAIPACTATVRWKIDEFQVEFDGDVVNIMFPFCQVESIRLKVGFKVELKRATAPLIGATVGSIL